MTGPVRQYLPEPHEQERHGHPLSTLAPPMVRRIVAFSVGYGLAFGAVEVAMPAFAEAHGGRALGSICLAAWSAGSLIGGLLAAGHRPEDPLRSLRLISVLFAFVLLLPLLAGSVLMMALFMLIAGLPIAPSFALTYGMVQHTARPGTQAEVFGWLSTAIVVGIAAEPPRRQPDHPLWNQRIALAGRGGAGRGGRGDAAPAGGGRAGRLRSPRRAETNCSTAKSSSSMVWAADICVRIRALPCGTTG